jgi:hypothetical protein
MTSGKARPGGPFSWLYSPRRRRNGAGAGGLLPYALDEHPKQQQIENHRWIHMTSFYDERLAEAAVACGLPVTSPPPTSTQASQPATTTASSPAQASPPADEEPEAPGRSGEAPGKPANRPPK